MKLFRRHDKRIGIELVHSIDCRILHPVDNRLYLRGRLLDLGVGGLGMRMEREEVPDWALDAAVIVRADLPETGGLLRRMARMHHRRGATNTSALGYVWDMREAASPAYERVQSLRLQRFLVWSARRDAQFLNLSPLLDGPQSNDLLGYRELTNDREIVRIERLPAAIL